MSSGKHEERNKAAAYRCPNCNSEMIYDAAARGLRCDHCGTTREVPAEGPAASQIQAYDLMAGLRQEQLGGMGRPAKAVRCKECGATVQYEPNVTTAKCLFCDSSYVAPHESSTKAIRPESLIPFQIDKAAASKRFSEWIGRLWFRPSDLKQRAKLENLDGVYIPYWVYNAHVHSRWTADAGYYEYVTVTKRDSEGKERTVQERRIRWVPASGQREDDYRDLLVCASSGLPSRFVARIENFNCASLVPYNPGYLAGWRAEEYVIGLQEGWDRCSQRIAAEQYRRCAADVPGDTHRALSVNNSFSNVTWRHVLLPIWIAAYRYRQKAYRFVVNGQTGQLAGEAPWSWVKLTILFLVIAAVIAGLAGYLGLMN